MFLGIILLGGMVKVTDKSIYTVLWSLGLPKNLCHNLVYTRWRNEKGIEKFEEIRHHEIGMHYPRDYRQRKYFRYLKND